MKISCAFAIIAAVGLLSQNGLRAETITLLESFENGVENVSHNLGEADQRISKFAQSDTNDLGQVTDGDKALQVSFESLQGWRQDFNVLLSPEATAILDGVIEGFVDNPEIGRFYLLYDITWDTLDSGAGWANNPINIGGYGTDAQIEWGGGGQPVTMNYDLGAGLPEEFAR